MKSLLLNSELAQRLSEVQDELQELGLEPHLMDEGKAALAKLRVIIRQLKDECKNQEYWVKQGRKRKGYPRVIVEYDKGSGSLILWNFAGDYITTVFNHGQLLPLLEAESKLPGTIEAVVKGRSLKSISRIELKAALEDYLKVNKIKKFTKGRKLNVSFSEIENLL